MDDANEKGSSASENNETKDAVVDEDDFDPYEALTAATEKRKFL